MNKLKQITKILISVGIILLVNITQSFGAPKPIPFHGYSRTVKYYYVNHNKLIVLFSATYYSFMYQDIPTYLTNVDKDWNEKECLEFKKKYPDIKPSCLEEDKEVWPSLEI